MGFDGFDGFGTTNKLTTKLHAERMYINVHGFTILSKRSNKSNKRFI